MADFPPALRAGSGFAQTAPVRAPAKKSAPAKSAPKTVAQKDPPAPTQWPVEALTVEGNRNYTREQVLAVAGLKVGQLAGKPEFEAARDRLTASGVFETVGYKFEPGPNKEGFVASFQVTEVEPTYPIRFEELGVPEKEIETLLHAKDPLYVSAKLPATKPLIDRYTNWIQEFLASKGLTEKIAGKVTQLSADQFAIVFRPARNLPAVAQVTFQGNQVMSQTVLREAVHGTAIGSPYTESGFRDLLNSSLRPLYEQRGRVRVSFPEVRAEPVNDVEGVHVFVKIDEGQSYELGKVAIAGPSPVDPASLIKTGDFKTGDVANFDRVHDGLDKIRKAVRRAGYLDVKVTSDRSIDDAKKTVDVAVHIERRRAVHHGQADHRGAGPQRRGRDPAHLDHEGRQDAEPRVSRSLPQSDQGRGALRGTRRDQSGPEGGREKAHGGCHAELQGGGPHQDAGAARGPRRRRSLSPLSPSAALLVIDVQQAIDHPSWGERNNPQAESNIAALLAAWRTTGRPIYHVRHDSTEPQSHYRPGQPGHEFKPEAMPRAGEPVVAKRTNSAFIGTDLESRLRAAGVETLIVAGVITNNSVEATVRMAGNLGFATFVVEDACFTFGRKDWAGTWRTAAEVHAMSLANLAGEYATVVTTAAILEALGPRAWT